MARTKKASINFGTILKIFRCKKHRYIQTLGDKKFCNTTVHDIITYFGEQQIPLKEPDYIFDYCNNKEISIKGNKYNYRIYRTLEEKHLHKKVCRYLSAEYPDIIFSTDHSGLNLSIGQSKQIEDLKSNRGMPDLNIFEPNRKYHGLFLELKVKTPYKKKGGLYASKRLKEQDDVHKKLNKKKYYACFVWDFNQIKELIKKYLTNKL